MLELGVIADDLTGAMMVASLLEREGVQCPVVTSVDALADLDDEAQAVVVGRKILALPPEDAAADARRSGQGLLAKRAKRIYYKYSALFSSTARGNIGPVAEALMGLTGADHVLFCPAFPMRNATVYQGRLFLQHRMLHESAKSRDPITPMTNSNLVEVLQAQSRVPVGLLPHRILRGGAERFLAAEARQGTRFFIVDAIDGEDLARVAALTARSPLTTGSDELPIHLARRWPGGERRAAASALLPPAPGYAAVLAGSCSPKTNRQLRAFEQRHPLRRVDLLQVANDAHAVDDIVAWAAGRLKDGPVGIATTTDADGVRRTQEALGRQRAAALAEDLLACAAGRLHELGARKFVVAGGETCGKVIDALGIRRLRASPFDSLGGGYCHATGDEPLSLVTKSGGGGEEDFFTAALERLRTADAQGDTETRQ